MSCECANVQRNVEKARLINRRTYFCREKLVKTLRREKRWKENNYFTNVAINGKKSIKED